MTVNSVVESAMLFILFIYLFIYLFIWKFYILSVVWENNFKRLLKISFAKKKQNFNPFLHGIFL